MSTDREISTGSKFRNVGIFLLGLSALIASISLLLWVLRTTPNRDRQLPEPEMASPEDVRQVLPQATEILESLEQDPEYRERMIEALKKAPMTVVEEKTETLP